MGSYSLGKIFKVMMTDDQSGIFLAHPHPSHPRVAIRVRKINVPCDKNVLIIRAPGRENEHTKNRDFKRDQRSRYDSFEQDFQGKVRF